MKSTATLTQEETITVHNAIQHNLDADPLLVHILVGKVHTVQITRINQGIGRDEYDIEVSTLSSREDESFQHVATVRGIRALWLIVELFLNEKVDI